MKTTRTRRTTSLSSVFLANGTTGPMADPAARSKRRRVPAPAPLTDAERAAASAWIADRLTAAPGRIAAGTVFRSWASHADALGINPGSCSEYAKLILAAHPGASIQRARSGRDVKFGWHIEGVAFT